MLQEIRFDDVSVGSPYDTFAEAGGEDTARLFEVYGYTFMGRKPEVVTSGLKCFADSDWFQRRGNPLHAVEPRQSKET